MLMDIHVHFAIPLLIDTMDTQLVFEYMQRITLMSHAK
jgi:hypothetical protein